MSNSAVVTYYDRPIVKSPVWIWTVPAYFFVGGIAGTAMTLGLATQLVGGTRLRAFAERCHWIGAIGGSVGSVLLIADLGRPGRFLNMLRVFRASSPMSIGSWVLALATPMSGCAALLSRNRGALRWIGDGAGLGAGLLGMPLATYTAVLFSNSAVPVWLATRRSLPLLFGASAMASLASVLELMPLDDREQAMVHRFAITARVADVTASALVKREADADPRVGRPLHEGVSGALWVVAEALTVASLVLSLLPGKSKPRRTVASICGIFGGLALRFAIFHAGKASTRDPRATFSQQQ